jgi:alpha-1,3-glucosyltransferase
MWVGFSSHFPGNSTHEGNKVNRSRNMVKENNHIGWIGLIYLSGFAAIGTWSQFFYHHVFGDRLAFLPLIVVSFYSGLGIMYSWIWQLVWIVKHT